MTEKELQQKLIKLATTRMSLFLKINEYKDFISEISGTKSPTYSFTNSKTSNTNNSKVTQIVCMIEDFEKRIENYRKELDLCIYEFEELLTPLQLSAHMIFRLRYLNQSTWASIASRTGYCERQVRRLHEKGLKTIVASLEEESCNKSKCSKKSSSSKKKSK